MTDEIVTYKGRFCEKHSDFIWGDYIDEEDIELVQAIAFNLNSLKQQYESEIIGQGQPRGTQDEG